MPIDPPPPADDVPPVPDEVWDRFLADNEQAIRASAPKEPSARARQVAARLSDVQTPDSAPPAKRPGRWRRPGKAAPQVWRAWPDPPRRTARSFWKRFEPVLGLTLLVALILAGLNAGTLRGWLHSGAATAAPRQLPPETALPTAAPPTPAPDLPTPQRPFAGSPAEQWAGGADAIVLPAATPVGRHSSAQVADALQLAKDYLVATNLDPQTLRGNWPTAALDLVDPLEPSWVSKMTSALRHPSNDQDPLGFVTRYDPAKLKLVGGVVKVRGEMTFSQGQYGAVAVHADYTFVYPFSQVGGGSDEVSRSIVRRLMDFETGGDPAQVQATAGRLTVIRTDEQTYNQPCDFTGGYLSPQFGTEQPSGSPGTGRPVDPYDRSATLGDHHNCGLSSRA